MKIETFKITVPETILDDLRDRLGKTRWPNAVEGANWNDGTDLHYLKELVQYWKESYDWRAQENKLNSFPQFKVTIDGISIHFVHVRSKNSDAIPLVMTNGWPSTFIELLPLVPMLTDPQAHGLNGPSFHVVIPSLPGYGFSERPLKQGITTQFTADIWHKLMKGLGYRRYGAQGGDFGAAVATHMALTDPSAMIGLHLSTIDIFPYTGPDSRPLSKAEKSYLSQYEEWLEVDGGYKAIQSTRPQTLSYALNDSPVGLAAWVVEKFRAWSDCDGDVERRFSKDELLTNIMLYWITESMPTAMRDYYDDKHFGKKMGANDFITVPTAVALFGHQFISDGIFPREWVERLYNIQRFTTMPRGAHFAPMEEPKLLAEDIITFFSQI